MDPSGHGCQLCSTPNLSPTAAPSLLSYYHNTFVTLPTSVVLCSFSSLFSPSVCARLQVRSLQVKESVRECEERLLGCLIGMCKPRLQRHHKNLQLLSLLATSGAKSESATAFVTCIIFLAVNCRLCFVSSSQGINRLGSRLNPRTPNFDLTSKILYSQSVISDYRSLLRQHDYHGASQ